MRRFAFLAIALAVSCTPIPPPRPAAPAPPAPAVVPTLPPRAPDWRDLPETEGAWTYGPSADGSTATFGRPGAPPAFTIACRPAERRVALIRAGVQASAMTVTTSYGATTWPAGAEAGGTAVLLAASDPALDHVAFSRGRFTVEVAGAARLVIPAWAEPARVIEDCRG